MGRHVPDEGRRLATPKMAGGTNREPPQPGLAPPRLPRASGRAGGRAVLPPAGVAAAGGGDASGAGGRSPPGLAASSPRHGGPLTPRRRL